MQVLKVVDDKEIKGKYVENLDYAQERTGISTELLQRACRAGKLTFAVGLPPEGENIKWRYLVDVLAFEKCLKGEMNLFRWDVYGYWEF